MTDEALPTFIVIGAMKAGTTSLHAYLDDHPEVFMADPKELHYFVAERNWIRGPEWYREKFARGVRRAARGEASPSYTIHPYFDGVPERMAVTVPDVRLVYVLRHPLQRLRSMYLHSVASGYETKPIADAFRSDPVYLDSARYWHQIQRYLAHFEREQLLVVTAEDLRDERAATLARIFEFIGVSVEPAATMEDRELHAGGAKRVARRPEGLSRVVARRWGPGTGAPPPVRWAVTQLATRPVDPDLGRIEGDLRAEVLDVVSPEIAGLRTLLGADFHGWGL